MSEAQHSGHCRPCKERVREMLIALYGECRANNQFPWSTKPEDYRPEPLGDGLHRIRAALCALRGHRDFIKSPVVPPCDYYVSGEKLIVEFDESQHFTRARLTALSLYSADLKYGFSLERWKDLCRRIDAKDDTPIDRDERRAWYDVLRDLIPAVYGFKPTVRLYAGDYEWCSLDAADLKDHATFQGFLGRRETVD